MLYESFLQIVGDKLTEKTANYIVSELFGDNNEALTTTIVEEVCKRMEKIVDNAFMQEYVADSNSIARMLKDYMITGDKNILDEIYIEAIKTVERLRRFNSLEGILACLYASGLHLISIRILSDYESKYLIVLKETGKEYATWAMEKTNSINRIISESISPLIYSEMKGFFGYGYYIERRIWGKVEEKLFFEIMFRDYWDNIVRSIREGPIVLDSDQSLFIRSGGHLRNNLYFDESAQNDTVLTNYFKKFNEKAKQEYNNYFNNRKAISTHLINVIKNTCIQWENL